MVFKVTLYTLAIELIRIASWIRSEDLFFGFDCYLHAIGIYLSDSSNKNKAELLFRIIHSGGLMLDRETGPHELGPFVSLPRIKIPSHGFGPRIPSDELILFLSFCADAKSDLAELAPVPRTPGKANHCRHPEHAR